jgi:hypothetical protein
MERQARTAERVDHGSDADQRAQTPGPAFGNRQCNWPRNLLGQGRLAHSVAVAARSHGGEYGGESVWRYRLFAG